jgi:hypothetical protein
MHHSPMYRVIAIAAINVGAPLNGDPMSAKTSRTLGAMI